MDKEYICGVPFSKNSKITGDLFYLGGTTFKNIGEGKLVDSKGLFVCMAHSQFARDNILVGNDDRKGKERYELCKDIIKFFERSGPKDFEERIEPSIIRLWDNKVAMKYNQNAEDPGSPWI